ncbi:hypothetical protein [Sporosarcina sp. YIM B06819]|uniref:hypothetical protein n=1 Tax=Sporosarcina sp. YIM B06819 TaxID=3081769 RepID=UPI00298C4C61|nr:hypothetical protein [Sporosarcina sp. YIM B06819]
MTYPVSVFIMDVSNSSKGDIGGELSKYLHHVEKRIADWTKDITTTQVIHRSGDEIVVVSSGYGTAYTLAFYISQIWAFKDHKPYFGLSFGELQEDINAIDIETWIHPFMKQARYANDTLKQQEQKRDQFNFELTDFLHVSSSEGYHLFRSQFETLLNMILKLQQDQINEQTAIQSLVCSLFLVLDQQNRISHYLGRSASTISSHLKKGNFESITSAFNDVVKVLNSLQPESEHAQQVINNQLQQNIKRSVSANLHEYFSID